MNWWKQVQFTEEQTSKLCFSLLICIFGSNVIEIDRGIFGVNRALRRFILTVFLLQISEIYINQCLEWHLLEKVIMVTHSNLLVNCDICSFHSCNSGFGNFPRYRCFLPLIIVLAELTQSLSGDIVTAIKQCNNLSLLLCLLIRCLMTATQPYPFTGIGVNRKRLYRNPGSRDWQNLFKEKSGQCTVKNEQMKLM